MKDSLKIKCSEWDELINSFGKGAGLPARLARYNDIAKIMKGYISLSKWLYENWDDVQPFMEKYDSCDEEEFVTVYRKFKKEEAS
jgi:hypothetical protein